MSIRLQDGADDQQAASAEQVHLAWRQLLRGITPRFVARFVLIAFAVAVILWIAMASWPALLPFLVGGAVAYTVLPIVNTLDGIMPRPLAVLLTLIALALVLALIVWAIVPPLVREAQDFYLALPSASETQVLLDRLDAYVARLPMPAREFIRREANVAAENLRADLQHYLDRPLAIVYAGLRKLLSSIGFAIGFLVIPTWLLTILKDQPTVGRALNRVLPGWLAPDFWAIVRLLDRSFSAFVRSRIILSLVIGVGYWVGLMLLSRLLGGDTSETARYPILLAVLVGLLQLVPVVGPLVGAILSGLIGLSFSPRIAALVLVVWVVVQQVVGRLVTPRLERRVVDLHPAIAVMAIAALGQFGLVWVFLAAPVVAAARDLFRYAYNRLGELAAAPERESGAGQAFVARPTVTTGAQPRVPLVYRRGRATRQNQAP